MNPIKLISMFAIAAIPLASAAHAEPKPPAKISKAQAQAIALKVAPGTVVESDYEKEDGAWRYSFDIRQGERIHEVGVDANSGKIVESTYERAGDKD